jgi:hypothetical protein
VARHAGEMIGEAVLAMNHGIGLGSFAATIHPYPTEAEAIRNKLLMFRFVNHGRPSADPRLVDRAIEPRLNQVFVPLLSVIGDDHARAELKNVLHEYQRQLVADRGLDVEAQVAEVICKVHGELPGSDLNLRDITSRFIEAYASGRSGAQAAINAGYSQTIRVIGGTRPYTGAQLAGQLPAGLTFDPTTFVLSGTPVESGFFSPVFVFTDANNLSYRVTENDIIDTLKDMIGPPSKANQRREAVIEKLLTDLALKTKAIRDLQSKKDKL